MWLGRGRSAPATRRLLQFTTHLAILIVFSSRLTMLNGVAAPYDSDDRLDRRDLLVQFQMRMETIDRYV